MRIMILNGPNLNMLGIREPHIYGSTTLDAIKASGEEVAALPGAELAFPQSTHEGVLVDLIQSARTSADALIINPAAYSFTSIAMFDAMKIFDGPIYEVHISNIHARDELHRHSKLSAAVKGVIAGLGPYGYIVAMQAALHGAGQLPASLPPAVPVGPKWRMERDMQGAGYLAIWSDLAPQDETDWAHWITREHAAERVGITGFLACRFFAALGVPVNRYFILYELEDE